MASMNTCGEGSTISSFANGVCVCVYSGLTSLSTFFQSYHDGDRELSAHFYSAASLKYHVPDT